MTPHPPRRPSRPPTHRRPGRPQPRALQRALGSVLVCALGAALLLGDPQPAAAQFNGDFTLRKDVLEIENFLDWKAYQHPYAWQAALARAPNSFDGSAGSLSQRRFYVADEIRLQKDIGRYGAVLYDQHEDAFFRSEPLYQEIELRVGRGVYGSILGFPTADKRYTGVGFAVALGQRTDASYIRWTHLRQDRLYNRQALGLQRFESFPELDRLEARLSWDDRLVAQLLWREEHPTEFLTPSPDDPGQGLRETYRGRKGELALNLRWSATVLTGLSLRRDRERRTRGPLDADSTVSAAAQQIEFARSDVYAVLNLAGGNVLEAGAYDGAFRNQIVAQHLSDTFSHHLLTRAVYALWTYPLSDWFRWQFSFQVGRADLLTYDPTADVPVQAERSTQSKFGAGVILQEAGSYAVYFNSTWDTDILTHRAWDGGNVQVLFLF
jgi:hypothetical protein